jgi:hypothetical protein
MKPGWLFLHQLDTFAALEKSAIRETPSTLASSAIPGVLQLHDEMSAMS